MAQSYLIFDFGTNEEAAQQARHKLEGWKQGFRLDQKLELRFERRELEKSEGESADKKSTEKKKSAKSKGNESSDATARIRLIVKLDFSDHERLSHQRWLERIPSEEPFAAASPQVVRQGEADFDRSAELYDSLESAGGAAGGRRGSQRRTFRQ